MALSSLLTFIVDMSILFIGEKNIGNYHSPYFSNNQHQVGIVRRQKRLKQQQYRLQLFQQMRQKNEKARRIKQDEATYNRRYERLHTQQVYLEKPSQSVQRPPSYQKINREPDVFERNPMLKMRKKQNDLSYEPPSSFSFHNKIAKSPNNLFLHQTNPNKYEQRLKTQNLYEKNKFDTIVVDLEKRRKQLNDYQDKKIDEVYEKMLGSVQILNGSRQHSFSSKTPAFDSKRYNKYAPSKQQINPEEQQLNSFKLPPLYKQTKLTQQNYSQQSSQSSWREWYAKEKLRELESYYKKIVNNEPITHSKLSSNHQIANTSLRRHHD